MIAAARHILVGFCDHCHVNWLKARNAVCVTLRTENMCYSFQMWNHTNGRVLWHLGEMIKWMLPKLIYLLMGWSLEWSISAVQLLCLSTFIYRTALLGFLIIHQKILQQLKGPWTLKSWRWHLGQNGNMWSMGHNDGLEIKRSGVPFPSLVMCRRIIRQTYYSILPVLTQQRWVPGGRKLWLSGSSCLHTSIACVLYSPGAHEITQVVCVLYQER